MLGDEGGRLLKRIRAAVAIVLFAVATLASAAAQEPKFPAFTGYVVDDAGILSSNTRAQLTQALGDFQRASHRQVVVATVKSLQGYPIEDYGYRLGRAWGVGDKGKDTGAILLVAPAEKKVRIEVGYGLEGELTDAASKQIIEQIILPAFRGGDFNRGVIAGTAAILRTLGASATAVPGQQPSQLENFVQTTRNDPHQLWGFLVPLFIFGFFAFLRSHSYVGPVYGGPVMWRRGSGGFGMSSGGGFGGGFGGGGGGSFGGGGASGGW